MTSANLAATGDMSASTLVAIGVGPSYPFAFTGTGSIRTVSVSRGIDKINQSIHIILTTRPGERYMNPEFGSRLPDLVFEPNDFVLKDLLYLYTAQALERWERRILFRTVSFPTDPGFQDVDNYIIRMRILYMIRQTNTPGSYVFPFQRYPMPMTQVVTGVPVSAPDRGATTLASPFLFGG